MTNTSKIFDTHLTVRKIRDAHFRRTHDPNFDPAALKLIKVRITTEVKPGIFSSTFHFPEIMLNIITSDVHDSENMCPEYKVVSCRIRKAKTGFFRKVGEVLKKA